ncbi:type II secretion system protein GspD [Magnetococcales bacterium HHB-1]
MFSIKKSLLGVGLALSLLSWTGEVSASCLEQIRWKPGTFQVSYSGSQLEDVLRELLERHNGLQMVFRVDPPVEVYQEFANVSFSRAFAVLMEQYELDCKYDAARQIVTVMNRGKEELTKRRIYTPKSISVSKIRLALARMGVRPSRQTMRQDPTTNTLLLEGRSTEVDELHKLIKDIDEALEKRQAAAYEERRRRNQEQLWDVSEGKLKIEQVKLHYASVGQTTTKFQGETVTLPGIEESLKAFFKGLEVQGSANNTKTPAIAGVYSPKISIDKRTNSVIVQGLESDVQEITKFIEKLDQPTPLVELEVMIVDGSAADTQTFGSALGVNKLVGQNAQDIANASNVVSGTTTDLATVNQLSLSARTSSATVKSGVAQLAAMGTQGLGIGFLFQGTRELLDATLTALVSDSRVQTVASPRVVTLNNLPAKITNSTNLNIVVTTTDGTKSDLKTLTGGVTLEITPSLIEPRAGDRKTYGLDPDDHLVRLAISAENSSVGSYTSTSSSVSVDTQKVVTNVVMPDRGTYIMGGLFSSVRSEQDDGVPLLKDIPLVGNLFKYQNSSDTKKETIFIITPTVHSLGQVIAHTQSRSRSADWEFLEMERRAYREGQRRLRNESHLLPRNPGQYAPVMAEDE